MTYLKTLGSTALLLALAAIASGAFAPAASATVLCKAAESPCSIANHYSPPTKYKATSGVMTLTRTWEGITSVIECQSSQIRGSTLSTGGIGVGVEAQTELVDWTECVLAGSTKVCEDVWLTAGPSPKETFTYTSGTNGTLTLSGTGASEPAIRIHCGAEAFECTFKTPSLVFDVTGGKEATLVAEKETLKGFGLNCPQTLDWSGTYTFTEPGPLYVASS